MSRHRRRHRGCWLPKTHATGPQPRGHGPTAPTENTRRRSAGLWATTLQPQSGLAPRRQPTPAAAMPSIAQRPTDARSLCPQPWLSHPGGAQRLRHFRSPSRRARDDRRVLRGPRGAWPGTESHGVEAWNMVGAGPTGRGRGLQVEGRGWSDLAASPCSSQPVFRSSALGVTCRAVSTRRGARRELQSRGATALRSCGQPRACTGVRAARARSGSGGLLGGFGLPGDAPAQTRRPTGGCLRRPAPRAGSDARRTRASARQVGWTTGTRQCAHARL